MQRSSANGTAFHAPFERAKLNAAPKAARKGPFMLLRKDQ